MADRRKGLKSEHQIENRNRILGAGKPSQCNPAMQSKPAYIRVPEIAQRLGIGRIKTYAMLKAGLIPGISFGRGWIVTRYAFEQWERSCGMKVSTVGAL
jgi:excisionase family DNA binding protein